MKKNNSKIIVILAVFFCIYQRSYADTYFYLEKPAKLPGSAPFKIIKKFSKPVLNRGGKGEWDGVDLLNPSVIYKDNIYYNYYSGFDGSVWRTGLATSIDGLKWNKFEKNPILDISNSGWDSEYIAANGCAIEIDGKIYYYYQSKKKKGPTQIGLAISEDGKKFVKYQNNPVVSVGVNHAWDSLVVADPYVFKYKGYYYMYYLGMDKLFIQRIGVAVSKDGITWEKSVLNPVLDMGVRDAFDENGVGEPSVVYRKPYFYMIYTGRARNEVRDIGVAISLDGIYWKKLSTNGIFRRRNKYSWDSAVICDSTLLFDKDNKNLLIWYGGGNKPHPAENINGEVGFIVADIQ